MGSFRAFFDDHYDQFFKADKKTDDESQGDKVETIELEVIGGKIVIVIVIVNCNCNSFKNVILKGAFSAQFVGPPIKYENFLSEESPYFSLHPCKISVKKGVRKI